LHCRKHFFSSTPPPPPPLKLQTLRYRKNRSTWTKYCYFSWKMKILSKKKNWTMVLWQMPYEELISNTAVQGIIQCVRKIAVHLEYRSGLYRCSWTSLPTPFISAQRLSESRYAERFCE
jgi:hypothetical protein